MRVVFYRSKQLSQAALYNNSNYKNENNHFVILEDRVRGFNEEKPFSSDVKNEKFFILNNKTVESDINYYLPNIVSEFINECKSTFNTRVLPFYFIPKKLLEELFFNAYPLMQEGNDIFILLPKEVETLDEINFNDANIPYRGNMLNDDFPQTLELSNQTLQLLHVADFTNTENSVFLITRNIVKRIKSIVGKYPSRLYQIEKRDENIIDRELENKVIPLKITNEKPIALIVHGFMSFTEGNFKALKNSLLSCKEYGRVFGYSYTPNKEGILKNGGDLRNTLRYAGLLDPNNTLDIYAHSLGGLVSRSMIQFDLDEPNSHSVRNFITAGTPHRGTPIALLKEEIYNPVSFPKHLAYILTRLKIDMSLTQAITHTANLFKEYFTFHNPGLRDLGEESRFINYINAENIELNINGSTFLVGYKNNKSINPIIKPLLDRHIFKNQEHDGVVPFNSSRFKFTDKNYNIIDSLKDNEGGHSDYYNLSENAEHIVKTVST